ncbi:MAG: YdeI/OmpD-associated family protein [Saccharofermentanales bacterium]
MKFEFDAEIKRLDGKIQWSVFYFPESAEECFGSKGNIPVKISVDGHPFLHTLLGSRNGHYLVYNEFIRRAVGKDIGDILHVTLEKDEQPRVFTVPAYIETILKDGGVLEDFLKQPDYLKREQINKIELAKKEETKANRIQKLILDLGKNNDPLIITQNCY